MDVVRSEILLQYTKDNNGITGDFHDTALRNHISEVVYHLEDAGVPMAVLESEKAKGVISRGAMDLWNNGDSNGDLSPYFYKRALQLKYGKVETEATA